MVLRSKKLVYLALSFALLAATVAALARYQATIYLMPTPVVIGEGDVNPFAINPNLRTGSSIPILFATNRTSAGPMEDRLYTIFPGDKLRMGMIRIQLGGEKTTWEQILDISTSPGVVDRPPLRLREIKEVASIPIDETAPLVNGKALTRLVNRALEASIDKDLTIYVHGANTGLYRASAQAAQYRHFTGRNSVVMVYLWPSAANLLGYGTDSRHARTSAPAFARLLELVADHTSAENINILAYSAGAQIVSPALDILGRRMAPHQRQRLRLGQLYFAAGDIGVNTFVEHMLSFVDIPSSTTVAMNRKDSVLALAAWREKVSRIGRPNLADLNEQEQRQVQAAASHSKLAIIEVSPETMAGMRSRSHDFWFSHPWVSNDILIQFLFHKPPSERGLLKTDKDSAIPVWTFPQDYRSKVHKIIQRAIDNG